MTLTNRIRVQYNSGWNEGNYFNLILGECGGRRVAGDRNGVLLYVDSVPNLDCRPSLMLAPYSDSLQADGVKLGGKRPSKRPLITGGVPTVAGPGIVNGYFITCSALTTTASR